MDERAKPVRPRDSVNNNTLQPIIEESDGADEDKEEKQEKEWKMVAEKVDEIARRAAEHLDDDNGKETQPPPMVKAPKQPTREEYERHQATHTRRMQHGVYIVQRPGQ